MKKRLTVNFVSHLHPFHFHGGGEQVTNRLIREGRARGHRIKTICMRPAKLRLFSRVFRFRNPDLWICYDVFNCPDERSHFSRRFIDRIIETGRYVIGQNAYGDICYLNALPCNGEIGDGTRCVEDRERYYGYRGNSRHSKWRNGYCPVNDNRAMFCNALMNIFLSPLHARVFHGIYPETASKTRILRPLIDVEAFVDKKVRRDIRFASYGGGSEAKGFYNLRERFPEGEVVFFGARRSRLGRRLGCDTSIGRIPYEQMPAFLNRVENLVHLPRWPEPHGLIINQAALCGCNLITNDNVGALTHDFDMLDREAYRKHATDLWERIEEIV